MNSLTSHRFIIHIEDVSTIEVQDEYVQIMFAQGGYADLTNGQFDQLTDGGMTEVASYQVHLSQD